MTPHPDSPRALCDLLGLQIDLSRYLSPAIVGKTGKRHYYAHGGGFGRREATDVLFRLCSMKGIPTTPRQTYATELTPAGEQLCIPGTERQPVAGKPAQLNLFGG